jgi:hypothetical protein
MRRVYVPLYNQYYLDDRIDAAGEAAELLYVRGLAVCAGQFSDGYLSRSQATKIAGAGLTNVSKRIKALCDNGLWIPDGDGFRIRSWSKWNRPTAEILAARERDAARKRGERAREGISGVSSMGLPGPSPNGHVPEDSERIPDGVRTESETSIRSPGGVRSESATPHTHTTDPSGHYVSRPDRVRDARVDVPSGARVTREAAAAAAQERPRTETPPPDAAAEIAAVLAKSRAGRERRAATKRTEDGPT